MRNDKIDTTKRWRDRESEREREVNETNRGSAHKKRNVMRAYRDYSPRESRWGALDMRVLKAHMKWSLQEGSNVKGGQTPIATAQQTRWM